MSFMPEQHRSGITFSVTADLEDYPLADFTVTLYLRGVDTVDIVASDSGGLHLFENVAASWSAGVYSWQVIAVETDTSKVFDVCSGKIEILPSISGMAAGADQRSHEDKIIDEIERVLEYRMSLNAIDEKEVAGEEVTIKYKNVPTPELEAMLRRYKNNRAWKKRGRVGQSLQVRL